MFHVGDVRLPIVQAPMAGGPSTPELAIAVCRAGALGFLAAGYKQPDDVAADLARVRGATEAPFGINLFVPSAAPADRGALAPYLNELAPEAKRHGVELGVPRFEDDGWEAKLALVAAERVPVVSFTFGCPEEEVVRSLHAAGSAVWVTVTNVAEARRAEAAGAAGLVVQGTEAGGHRGSFVDDGSPGIGLLALLRLVVGQTRLPLIASGGIADGAGLAAVLCAGASAAQLGTALMLAPEAGTPDAQRALLKTPTPTGLTRAFTGRLARGLVNRFMVEHSASAPAAYPEIHHVTSRLRAVARREGDADSFNLWAGQAHELAERLPAGEIVTRIAADAHAALRDAERALSGQGRAV